MKSVKESETNVFKKFKMSFFRSFEFFEHALKSNIKLKSKNHPYLKSRFVRFALKHYKVNWLLSLNKILKQKGKTIMKKKENTNNTIKQKEKKTKVNITSKEEELKDDLNPIFIFSSTHTDLLVKAVKGEIILLELAKKELQNRGLSENGLWVGFKNEINS